MKPLRRPWRECDRVHTPDGREYHVRPIRPDDLERERAFIASLSPQSRYHRFMHAMREPSAQLLSELVHVDRHRTMALVATVGSGNEERIIGVARYASDPNGEDCEFAVAVADEWQCRGVGTTLTTRLFALAAEEGFRNIYGNVHADNARMIDLALGLGLHVETPAEGQGVVRAWRPLYPPSAH
jgi:acetyltransferase